jgi:hypothetical protein
MHDDIGFIYVRAPKSLIRELATLAEQRDQNVSQVVRRLVRSEIERHRRAERDSGTNAAARADLRAA